MKYLGLVLFVALSACASVSERSDSNDGVGFGNYDALAPTN
jgi:hypothetical protein